ncbi:hypothetical protein Rsub_00923 [Raphidocelis subcapitata]|uniref:Uncharacterized protein n=1 Tax=Raphidocelis subcapitata TaxID=307507 RepID=A0A2V0NLD7_9CHLO|nr:hypothetical protein Rsub_00923 [Raphidocelis subcapitata]|eukprot:GBF88211.1 hypothetical protein Rsub_00923 [Raphidocelis subcapitata]
MDEDGGSTGSEADVSDSLETSEGVDGAAASAASARRQGGAAGAAPPTAGRRRGGGTARPRKAGAGPRAKRSIRRTQALPVAAGQPARAARAAAAAAVAAADADQAGGGEAAGRGAMTSEVDAARLEACRQMYRSLPRASRYAQHRLRVLGRAIELLAIGRAARTAAQQRDLDDMLHGLKL